ILRSVMPGSTDPRRRLGAQAHHLAARRLRSSFTQLLLRSLLCSAPTHDLAHLDTNSLAAYRWIRAWVGCPEVSSKLATCYRHPDRETGLRCQRCERPVCPSCIVPAPVGGQCGECVRASPSRVIS